MRTSARKLHPSQFASAACSALGNRSHGTRITVDVSDLSQDLNQVSHLQDPAFEDLRNAASIDPEYTVLLDTVQAGSPPKPHRPPISIKAYWKIRNELWTENGLVLKGLRIIVPSSRHPPEAARVSPRHPTHQTPCTPTRLLACVSPAGPP